MALSVNEVFERTCHLSVLCGVYSPKDTNTEQLCRMHIVLGLHLIEDMVKAKTLWTLSGHQITFSNQVKDLVKSWTAAFMWDRLELEQFPWCTFLTRKPFSLISLPAPRAVSSFVESKARWFKTRHSKQPLLLLCRQPVSQNLTCKWSLCAFQRRDLFPALVAAAISMWLSWKRLQSLSSDWVLLLGDCVPGASHMLNVFLFHFPSSPLSILFFLVILAEFFIIMLWYGRLFFPFPLFNWLTFSSIHCCLSILHACSHLAKGEPYVSSLRIQPWPWGLGHNTCTSHASKGQSTIWRQGIRAELVNALLKFLSCLFTQESFDLGSLPSPSFVSARILSDVQGREEPFKKCKWWNEKHGEVVLAQAWVMAAAPIPWCLGYPWNISKHPASVHTCMQYKRTRYVPYNLESLTGLTLFQRWLLVGITSQ